jgi:predicted Rossmann-fold nucleotide-binding protein
MEYIDTLAVNGTISPQDKHLYLVSDIEDEIVEHIRMNSILPFGLKTKSKAWWMLGESKIK